MRDASLQFDPGSHFYYNNTRYCMLGMIIERVTGKPYGEYLREKLFVPLGLSSTVYCSTAPIIKHRARGYDRAPNGLANTAPAPPEQIAENIARVAFGFVIDRGARPLEAVRDP